MADETKENSLERAMGISVGHFAAIRTAMQKAEQYYKANTKRLSRFKKHVRSGK